MQQYKKGDIVKVSSKDTETIGLINQADDGILLIGTSWYDLEDFEVEVLHRELTST